MLALLTYGLFNDAVRSMNIQRRLIGRLVNNELERIRKKVVLVGGDFKTTVKVLEKTILELQKYKTGAILQSDTKI